MFQTLKMTSEFANLEINQCILHGEVSNSLHTATKEYVDTAINNIISGAPEYLDTLKEITDFLGTDGSLDDGTIIQRLSIIQESVDLLSNTIENESTIRNVYINDVKNNLRSDIYSTSQNIEIAMVTLQSEISNIQYTINGVSDIMVGEILQINSDVSSLKTVFYENLENEKSNLLTSVNTQLDDKLDNGVSGQTTRNMSKIMFGVWTNDVTHEYKSDINTLINDIVTNFNNHENTTIQILYTLYPITYELNDNDEGLYSTVLYFDGIYNENDKSLLNQITLSLLQQSSDTTILYWTFNEYDVSERYVGTFLHFKLYLTPTQTTFDSYQQTIDSIKDNISNDVDVIGSVNPVINGNILTSVLILDNQYERHIEDQVVSQMISSSNTNDYEFELINIEYFTNFPFERYRKIVSDNENKSNFQISEPGNVGHQKSYLYIGDYWRITAQNGIGQKKIVFEYNSNNKDDPDFEDGWKIAFPLYT